MPWKRPVRLQQLQCSTRGELTLLGLPHDYLLYYRETGQGRPRLELTIPAAAIEAGDPVGVAYAAYEGDFFQALALDEAEKGLGVYRATGSVWDVEANRRVVVLWPIDAGLAA